jgi:hypothetical protein
MKEIVVNLQVHGEKYQNDDLMNKIHECGWNVKVKKNFEESVDLS